MVESQLLARHFLAAYFVFIGLHYTATALGLWRRTGISHIHSGALGSAAWWRRQTFNLFRALIVGVCVARVFWPIDPWLGVFSALNRPPVLAAGMVLLLGSYARVAYVHAYMHRDWRSGIDPQKRQPLLVQGPFARSRNPLFTAIMLGQLGLFLTFPSVFTLVCLAVGAGVIRAQALAEERVLSDIYGEPYKRYCHQVGRWL